MQTIRLDLHAHLKVAKKMPFRRQDVPRFASTLRARGLDGLAIAEHFHARRFWDMYDALAADWPYVGGRFDVDGLLFYPGAELTLAENCDLVLLAPPCDLRRLDDAFESPLSDGYHPTAQEFLDVCDGLDLRMVRICAHPLRDGKGLLNVEPALRAALVDALEINARYHEQADDVERLAADLEVPLTGGSDAHVWMQAGAAWTTVAADGDSLASLQRAIVAGHVRSNLHASAASICEAGAQLKAALKAAHAGAADVRTDEALASL